jgi:hypothetical protein
VLQSFQFGADGEPGLNTDYTIEQSHAGGYYEVMVHPNAWINHDKGQIRRAPSERPKSDTQDSDGQDSDRQGSDGQSAGRKLARRNGDGDEQQKQPKVAAETDKDDDRKEIDLEELGREFLELIRKYADRIESPRRQADTRNDKVEKHQDQR